MNDEAPSGLAQAIIQSEAGVSLSRLVANVVGVLGGDRLALTRRNNLEALERKFEEKRKQLPGEATAIGPRVGMKALRAAADEDRPEMQDLWAGLLANGAAGCTVEDEFVFLLGRMNHDQVQILRSLVLQEGAGFQFPLTGDDADAKAVAYDRLIDLVRFGLAEKMVGPVLKRQLFMPTNIARRMVRALSNDSDAAPPDLPCDQKSPPSRA